MGFLAGLAAIAFPLRLSLQVALCATLLSAVVGVALAYVLATRDFPGRRIAETALTLPMVLPPVVTGYLLLLLVGREGPLARAADALGLAMPQVTFTWGAAVLAAFAVSVPLTIRSAKAAIEAVDQSLVASSYTLGRSELSTAVFVVLPLASRGIVAGVVLSFARAVGEFGATIMVAGNVPGRTNTMPLEIYNAVIVGDWGAAALLVGVFTLFSAAVLLAAGRLGRAVVA